MPSLIGILKRYNVISVIAWVNVPHSGRGPNFDVVDNNNVRYDHAVPTSGNIVLDVPKIGLIIANS